MGKLDAAMLPIALDAIVSNTDALVRLINNILFLQELDLIPPTFEPINLDEIVLPLVEALRLAAADNHLVFNVALPPALPVVRGDRNGLMQAIGALLDNAIKFSPDGGEIKVMAQVQNGRLALSIADPGVGIPPEELDSIFERFHHVESAEAHLFGGVGLGLPIARQVVEQHGGQISVVSEVDKGSTFTITLPLSGKN
jgi:signal transduction histidine kinase